MNPFPIDNMQFVKQQQQQGQMLQAYNKLQGSFKASPVQPQLAYNADISSGQHGRYNSSQNSAVPNMVGSYSFRKHLSNMVLLRIYEVFNHINMSMGKMTDYEFWNKFIRDLFTTNGVMRYVRKNGEEERLFEFVMPIIPSLLKFIGSSGVVRLEIVSQQIHTNVLSRGSVYFECDRCTITYYYPDGSYMTNFGQIEGIFDSMLKLEWCDMCIYSFVPGIEWNSLERVLSDQNVSYRIFQALSDPNSFSQMSSEKTKDAQSQNPERQSSVPNCMPSASNMGCDGSKYSNAHKPDNNQSSVNIDAIIQLRSQFKVFHNISSFGIQESLIRVLQVNDVMSYLKRLKIFQKVNNIQSPLESLSLFFMAPEEFNHAKSQPVNGATNKMGQPANGNKQPPTYSSLSFMTSSPYLQKLSKNHECKPKKKPVSANASSPRIAGEAMKSPMDSVNPDTISTPHRKPKDMN